MGETSSTTEAFIGWTPEMHATHAAVGAMMVRDKLTRANVADLSGVPYGTLSAWLTGKYAGRSDEVAAKVQRWMDGYQQQQSTRSALPADPPFQMTQTAATFLAGLQMAQALGTMAVISGGAGVGKTRTVCEYRRTTANVWVVTARPDTATMGALLEAVCDALAISERIARRRAGACIGRMRDTGGLMIVDEAQHLTTEALELLRSLHDAAGIGMVLVGNETVYSRLEGKGRTAEFAQLFSRIGRRIRRTSPLKPDIEALVAAWGITDAGQVRLLRAIGGKPGALRNIRMTMRQAHLLAMGEGEEGVITEDRIARAFSAISDTAAETFSRGGN
jgi:DNA transposition AAA+ family ATPase